MVSTNREGAEFVNVIRIHLPPATGDLLGHRPGLIEPPAIVPRNLGQPPISPLSALEKP
jgi:hypothetical protein